MSCEHLVPRQPRESFKAVGYSSHIGCRTNIHSEYRSMVIRQLWSYQLSSSPGFKHFGFNTMIPGMYSFSHNASVYFIWIQTDQVMTSMVSSGPNGSVMIREKGRFLGSGYNHGWIILSSGVFAKGSCTRLPESNETQPRHMFFCLAYVNIYYCYYHSYIRVILY